MQILNFVRFNISLLVKATGSQSQRTAKPTAILRRLRSFRIGVVKWNFCRFRGRNRRKLRRYGIFTGVADSFKVNYCKNDIGLMSERFRRNGGV